MEMSRRAAGKALLATAAAGIPGQAAESSLRRLPEERLGTQVCVVGGGSAGIGAALAAARAGAKVVLLERESVLGGTSTMAWVHTWEPCSGADAIPRDLYDAMKREPSAVVEPDYSKGAPRRGGSPLPFEPRALSFAAREMLDATGRCQVLLATTFCHARVEGARIAAVDAVFCGKRLTVEADVFVDCTADGDACADAGCAFHIGEDPKSRYGEPSAPEEAGLHLNGLTLLYRIADSGTPQKPHLPKGIRRGLCPRPTCIRPLPNGDLLLNPVDMIDGNAVVHADYSRLMRDAHHRVLEHFHWLQTAIGSPADAPGTMRRHIPEKGFATWTIAGIAPRIGVRESRRILGDATLTEHDCQAGVRKQKHPDIIAVTDHAVDIHGAKGRLYEVPNGPYGIPYRCLLPRGVENLMIASRAASFSHIAASSCRLSRTMITLGQAAGTAAALAVQNGVPPRKVDIAALQTALTKQRVALS